MRAVRKAAIAASSSSVGGGGGSDAKKCGGGGGHRGGGGGGGGAGGCGVQCGLWRLCATFDADGRGALTLGEFSAALREVGSRNDVMAHQDLVS